MADPGHDPSRSPARHGARSGEGPISIDELVGDARATTGLDDLGDPAAVEALGVLVRSIESEARLNPRGRRRVRRMLADLVAQRLRMVDFAATSDVVDYETVAAPIIVTGLPCTGSELLAELLAQDPANRALVRWQAATVAPPPALAELSSDPRLRAALVVDDHRRRALPALAAEYPTGATLPTECSTLLATSFTSPWFETMLDVPGYGDWFADIGALGAYRFHHLALRTLQTTVPTERWSLHGPAHLWHLDAVRAVYPHARLIVTHRDPARVVPGLANLCVTLRSAFSDEVDPADVGRRWQQRCRHALETSAPHLAEWDADAAFHLPHAELVDDPVGSIERAYQRFGIELSDLGRRRMAALNDQRPRRRPHARRDDASRFGLDAGELRRDFAAYMADHHVPSEA